MCVFLLTGLRVWSSKVQQHHWMWKTQQRPEQVPRLHVSTAYSKRHLPTARLSFLGSTVWISVCQVSDFYWHVIQMCLMCVCLWMCVHKTIQAKTSEWSEAVSGFKANPTPNEPFCHIVTESKGSTNKKKKSQLCCRSKQQTNVLKREDPWYK